MRFIAYSNFAWMQLSDRDCIGGYNTF